ncbi:hypothetical protein GOBAR_DD27947 [Gossypium barbadense]|nr:hypothetical protein GOBAR_DD27947 [Gossypium barbadense]
MVEILATWPWSHCKLSIRQPPTRPASVFYPSAMMNVLCKQCDKYLGERLVTGVTAGVGLPRLPIGSSTEQKFMLNPGELLYWNGSRLTYADTLNPVCNNE